MGEVKHTPGPWYPGHFGTDSSCQCRSIVSDGQYVGAIATVHTDNGKPISDGGNDAPNREEAIANMHLIAAAPDLLEALREATLALDSLAKGEGVFKPIEQTIVSAQAAISKATPSLHEGERG